MNANPYSPPTSHPQRRYVPLPLRSIGCVILLLSIVVSMICHWAAGALFTVVHVDSSSLPPANPDPNSDVLITAEFVSMVIQPNWPLLIPLLLSLVVGLVLIAWPQRRRPTPRAVSE